MEHGIAAWLLDRLAENLRIVKEAPEAIVIMAIVVALLVYLAIDKLYGERIAVLNDRIGGLNEQVAEYRNKLQGASPDEAAKEIADLRAQLETLSTPPLSGLQEKLLYLINEYQNKFSVTKLIISRSQGTLYFDNDRTKGTGISLLRDLYGKEDPNEQGLFENLIETMPSQYLRFLPEMRLNSPFVVSITDAGAKYLQVHKVSLAHPR